jgi:hypothetical protein
MIQLQNQNQVFRHGVVADAAPPEPPAAPSNARIEDFIEECGDPSASYTVAWDDNSDNELGFEVWRDVGGTGFELYATVGPNVTSIDEITKCSPSAIQPHLIFQIRPRLSAAAAK